MNGWELKIFGKNKLIPQKLPWSRTIQHTKHERLAGRILGTLAPNINTNIGGQISLMVSKDIISQAAAGEKVIPLDK